MVFDFANLEAYILRPHLVINWKRVARTRIFGCETTVSVAEIDKSTNVIVLLSTALAATPRLPV
jgi:hypothetical protein